jgi:acyl-coenzyme A thioesterase PaaI-like protein
MPPEPGLVQQPSSRFCFLCGVENPSGLRLLVYQDPVARQVLARLAIPARFQSYPGVAHGGIVATLLDEVAGRASLIDGGNEHLLVTVSLEVRYRHPTPIETPVAVVGWMTQPGLTRARAHGEVRLPDGTVTAEADLLLVRPPAPVLTGWETEKPFWRVYPPGNATAAASGPSSQEDG